MIQLVHRRSCVLCQAASYFWLSTSYKLGRWNFEKSECSYCAKYIFHFQNLIDFCLRWTISVITKSKYRKKMKNSSKHKKTGPSLISNKFVVRNFRGKKLKRSRNDHQQTLFKVQDKVLRNNWQVGLTHRENDNFQGKSFNCFKIFKWRIFHLFV